MVLKCLLSATPVKNINSKSPSIRVPSVSWRVMEENYQAITSLLSASKLTLCKMSDMKAPPAGASEGKRSVSQSCQHFIDKYIFPGKLFPCYRHRVGEDGEILTPPTLSELLKYEADNAQGDDKAPSYLNGRIRGYLAFDSGKSYYYKWLIVINLAVMYNLIFIIGRACFWELDNLFPLGWIVLDYSSDVIYVIDMFVRYKNTIIIIVTVICYRAHEGYLDQGIMVKDSKLLRAAYRKSSWFKKDVISILPTDFLYFLFPGECRYQIPCKVIFRLNRIAKIERMFQFFDKTETSTNFPNAFRILKIVFYILVLIHWNACVYFTVSFYIGFNTDSWVYQVGSERINQCRHTD